MRDLSRREILRRMVVGAAVAVSGGCFSRVRPDATRRIPLLHLTDLYQPAQDPDDQVDLATIVGLEEYDLRGVVLDITEKFLAPAPAGWDIAREPGFGPVARLAQLTRRRIPAALGPIVPLSHPEDTARDRPVAEQAGIALLLEVLERSAEPVTISIVGSARALAAAFNREPALVRAKTRAVLLNAGSTGGAKREWNVGLDPAAYVALWRSGLPLHWFPCATERGAFDPTPERGTYWKAPQASLFKDLSVPLHEWLEQAFAGMRPPDHVTPSGQSGGDGVRDSLLAGDRNMWSTASLIMGAERVLARTAAGWRFVPAREAAGADVWPMRLDPIRATVDQAGQVEWKVASEPAAQRIFGRKAGADYGPAMTEALNALLRGIPV